MNDLNRTSNIKELILLSTHSRKGFRKEKNWGYAQDTTPIKIYRVVDLVMQ
jgi:hypothetical protein